jgi:Ser/Thr protein kinase RdoA (MazF antagonist)
MHEGSKALLEKIADRILKEAAKRFGVAFGKLMRFHDSVKVVESCRFIEKSLHQYDRDGRYYILRLTHPLYVDFEFIPGEVDWINYLADHGVRAPRVITSRNGELVEIIEDEDSPYAAVSFEKVEGREIVFDDPDEWNTDLFVRYGRTIGRMHALTKRYAPRGRSLRRIKWYEQDWVANIDRYLPASEFLIRQKHRDLMRTLHGLPRDRDSYGLIHGDAHPWNVLFHQGDIILTDFDFCERSWFASDIAIVLFYAVMAPVKGMDKSTFANCFLKNFMTGYLEENNLDAYWIEQIPFFLRLRMISKYILHYPEWQSNTMTENRESAFIDWKRKIEKDIPYLDLRE